LLAVSVDKQQKNTERKAEEIKLRAERRAGELLEETPKASGGYPYQSTGTTLLPVENQTLEEIGITKNQSSKWQKIASRVVYLNKPITRPAVRAINK
jgi:hypothetical protein